MTKKLKAYVGKNSGKWKERPCKEKSKYIKPKEK